MLNAGGDQLFALLNSEMGCDETPRLFVILNSCKSGRQARRDRSTTGLGKAQNALDVLGHHDARNNWHRDTGSRRSIPVP